MEIEIGVEGGQMGGQLHTVDDAEILVLLGQCAQDGAGFMEGLGTGHLLPVGAPDRQNGKDRGLGIQLCQLGIKSVGVLLKILGRLTRPVVGTEGNGDQIGGKGQIFVQDGRAERPGIQTVTRRSVLPSPRVRLISPALADISISPSWAIITPSTQQSKK